jgi:ubiquinone/menaquinone biosynthesis C-methylase UbiE
VSDFAEEVKARIRESWALGNYAEIAKVILPVSEALVEACAISAGQEVLDVAAGNGNLSLMAAREGAAVVASDLTPAMVELGRKRLADEGYDVEWVVADVEDLPFDDARFDCCASVFGAMFAPRPDVAAGEMFRVVRPGGTVGLAAWTPGGFQGKVFALGNKYVPMPQGAPRSTDWGDEEIVRQRLDPLASSVSFQRGRIRHEWESAEGFFEFSRNAGPTIARARTMSDEDRASMKQEILGLIDEFNQADSGRIVIDNEYLLTVARKRG